MLSEKLVIVCVGVVIVFSSLLGASLLTDASRVSSSSTDASVEEDHTLPDVDAGREEDGLGCWKGLP